VLVDKTFKGNKFTDFTSINKEKEKLFSELNALDKETEELSRRESELTKSLQEFNENFRSVFTILEEERAKLSKLYSEQQRLSFEKERINLQFRDLESQLSEIGRAVKDFRGWEGMAPDNPDAAMRRMFRLRSELAGIGEVDEALVKEASEAEERYNFLVQQTADLKKAVADLKALTRELENKIRHDFSSAIKQINEEFTKFVRLMFGGGKASLYIQELTNNGNGDVMIGKEIGNGDVGSANPDIENVEVQAGVEIEITLPRKRIKGLEALSGGERSLVSIAALFALISVSPPPFLVLDEVDAALDERNAKRFGELLADFAEKTQFIIVTHNRATMEAANILYGVTMSPDGTSKIVSLKLE
jgi:chromosome segregation protein